MGLGLALVHGGLAGLASAGLGAVLAFVITFPQWRLGWLGGGDAKLMMVVGSFLGTRGMIDVMLWSLVLHGLVSIGMAVTRNMLARAGSPRTIQWGVPMAVAIAAALPLAMHWPLLSK